MGFKPTDSVLTVGTGWSSIASVGSVQHLYPPQNLIRDYMKSLTANGSGATILMDPTVAGLLKDVHGFQTKAMFAEWLSLNVEKTASSYWGNAVVPAWPDRWRCRARAVRDLAQVAGRHANQSFQ